MPQTRDSGGVGGAWEGKQCSFDSEGADKFRISSEKERAREGRGGTTDVEEETERRWYVWKNAYREGRGQRA